MGREVERRSPKRAAARLSAVQVRVRQRAVKNSRAAAWGHGAGLAAVLPVGFASSKPPMRLVAAQKPGRERGLAGAVGVARRPVQPAGPSASPLPGSAAGGRLPALRGARSGDRPDFISPFQAPTPPAGAALPRRRAADAARRAPRGERWGRPPPPRQCLAGRPGSRGRRPRARPVEPLAPPSPRPPRDL